MQHKKVTDENAQWVVLLDECNEDRTQASARVSLISDLFLDLPVLQIELYVTEMHVQAAFDGLAHHKIENNGLDAVTLFRQFLTTGVEELWFQLGDGNCESWGNGSQVELDDSVTFCMTEMVPHIH